jgi:very-long-chain ceramide synthase
LLKYVGWQTACDAAFATFVVCWLAMRHFAYNTICWSIYAYVSKAVMPYGRYSLSDGRQLSSDGGDKIIENLFQPFLHPEAETVGFNSHIRRTFLALLLGLQCITLMWFVMICRVVARVLRGEGADDTRSDGEDEDEDEEEFAEEDKGPVQPSVPFTPSDLEKPKFIEVEADPHELTYSASHSWKSGSTSKRKSKGISSGLNLGDRKDILNRIGCLSEEQLAREREKRGGSASPRPGSAGRKR